METSTYQKAYKPSKPTLFDVPVSNNGARIRWLLYQKGLEGVVDVLPPKEIGGLRSETYLDLNPQGKMPLMVLPDGSALPESQVIEYYILDKYRTTGPELLPATPEGRAHAALVVRLLDQYICPIQGCMYKPFDNVDQRAYEIAAISHQLDILEKTFIGPYAVGKEMTYADGALVPTFVFLTHILPRYFKWKSVFTRRPQLGAWWELMKGDGITARVIDEVEDGLAAWDDAKRWEDKGITAQVADNSYDWTCAN